MLSVLKDVVSACCPTLVERVLQSGRRMYCVRRFVIGINQRSRRYRHRSHGLKCCGPSALREIVIEHAETRTNNCFLAGSGRVDDSQTGAKLFSEIGWNRLRIPQLREERERRIGDL